MKCKSCGAFWKIGNISPEVDICPVCDVDFIKNPETREFESITELLYFLINKNGIEYWANDKGINGYLNDYFPEKIEIRNDIKLLLEQGFSRWIIEWYSIRPSREEIKKKIDEVSFYGNVDEFIDSIMFLVGSLIKEGTVVTSPAFYKEYAATCLDIEKKVIALKKAIQYGADEETELELANLKITIDSEAGLKILQNLAERGNVEALLRLAKIYESGVGVQQDYQREIEYLNKAILNNSAEAMFQLGRLYMLGLGFAKNKQTAIELFERAAEQRHVKANYQLYFVYCDKGSEYRKLALEKLQISAETGYLPAMYEYAIHLLYGEYISENVTMAISILESCALQGYEEAIEKLRYIYSVGYKVSKDRLKALEWQEKLIGGI